MIQMRPFIFTFLFELHTESLALPSFYHSLHHQLGPLQRPLLASTSHSALEARVDALGSSASEPLFDLVFDPETLTVHSSIPNIPEPTGYSVVDPPYSLQIWTRLEALNVHTSILNTYVATRRIPAELERTCKTNRGWWIVRMSVPDDISKVTSSGEDRKYSMLKEIFLVRRASDYVAPKSRKASSRFGREISGSSSSTGWGAGKL